jgi:menaquinone-dependent protoporphyrinogen oxidase
MDTSILVAYATKHGSTGEVAQEIAATLRRADFPVDLRKAAEVDDIGAYSGVVLGGALYMGRWHRDAVDFLDRFATELDDKVLAVFAMGPRELTHSEVSGSRVQLGRALARSAAPEPDSVAIFGGVIDPAKHHFPFNRLPASDARDWVQIEDWTREIGALFRYGKPATAGGDSRRQLQQTPR